MKPKEKPQRLNGGFCFFLVVATLVSSCGLLFVLLPVLIFGNPQLVCFGTILPSAPHFEEFAQIRLPDSVSNMRYTVRESSGQLLGLDCTLWLQFEMNADDFEELKYPDVSQLLKIHFRETVN